MNTNKDIKIQNILKQIKEVELTLKDIVDYQNKQNKKKICNLFDNKHRSWASDDEDDDIYILDDDTNCNTTIELSNSTEEVQNFICDILNNDDLATVLMSSWMDIKTDKRCNVYTKDDFKHCIQNKIKECVNGWECSNKNCTNYYHIFPEAHCPHTHDGTLCDNVVKCDKIHIQRCIYEIDHYKNGKLIRGKECLNKNKSCKFIHKSDLKSEKAKQNFENTMNEYKKKKYKQFFS